MSVNELLFSWRMLRRDAGAGELRLLAAALVVAVAALTAVGFFTDRVRQSLDRQANQLLGADLLLSADRAWPDTLTDAAERHGLRVATTRTFPSMVSAGDGATRRVQLAEIKAVSEGYPLRGALRIRAPQAGGVQEGGLPADEAAVGIPAPGRVWLEDRAAAALGVRVGDTLAVGRTPLIVGAILTQEPDRGVNFFSVAPRVMIRLDDLPASGLIGPGSRVVHRLLVAGDAAQVKRFRTEVEAQLTPGQRIEDVDNARPEIRSALERAQRFLGIAAVLTVVLAAVAVALAARRYMQRHLDACAVMRCLGATQALLMRTHLLQFLILGLAASGLGCLVGYLAHHVLHAWLAQLLASPLPAPGIVPALQGLAAGMLLLFGFAVPPLVQLQRVSTLRVLRREFGSGRMPAWRFLLAYALGFFVLMGMMFWVAGDARLGTYLVGGFSAALLVFLLLARLIVRLVAALRGGSGAVGWRFGLASLERHALASVVQIVALALAFMALLLLTATRNDLLDAWRRAAPADAPNRFVINIQPEQLSGVRQRFSEAGLSAEFSPMVRGRLTQVNAREVGAGDYTDERAKRLIDREFNLSYRAALPDGNRVTQGRWFAPGETAAPLASVEEGLAKTLGLKVGDRLRFSIAGEAVEVRIVGLRKLNWDSMRVNFFVLTPPGVLEPYPASWITSIHLPAGHEAFVNELIAAYPNLTVVDIAAIVAQLQVILEQVARAVQFVFLFTLLAGVIVLYSALASAAEERRYELAVLRALGATQAQLRRALCVELAAIGASAGLIAGVGALVVGQVVARRVFQFEVAVDYALPLVSVIGAAVLVVGAGWLAARRLLRTPPLESLRRGG